MADFSGIQSVTTTLRSLLLNRMVEAAERAGRTSRAGGRTQTEREPGEEDDEDEFVEKELARLFKEAKCNGLV